MKCTSHTETSLGFITNLQVKLKWSPYLTAVFTVTETRSSCLAALISYNEMITILHNMSQRNGYTIIMQWSPKSILKLITLFTLQWSPIHSEMIILCHTVKMLCHSEMITLCHSAMIVMLHWNQQVVLPWLSSYICNCSNHQVILEWSTGYIARNA